MHFLNKKNVKNLPVSSESTNFAAEKKETENNSIKRT